MTLVASTFFPKQARATLTSYHIQEGKGVAMVTITSDRDCDKKRAGLPWGGGDHDQRPLPFSLWKEEGGGLACLGREVEATNVTSTLLIQMRQDAFFHLDEAIVTTTPQLFPHRIGTRGGHGHTPSPQGNPALIHETHKLSCLSRQWIDNGGFHFLSQASQGRPHL